MFVVNHKGFVGNKISPGKTCCHGGCFIQLFFQVKVCFLFCDGGDILYALEGESENITSNDLVCRCFTLTGFGIILFNTQNKSHC